MIIIIMISLAIWTKLASTQLCSSLVKQLASSHSLREDWYKTYKQINYALHVSHFVIFRCVAVRFHSSLDWLLILLLLALLSWNAWFLLFTLIILAVTFLVISLTSLPELLFVFSSSFHLSSYLRTIQYTSSVLLYLTRL